MLAMPAMKLVLRISGAFPKVVRGLLGGPYKGKRLIALIAETKAVAARGRRK